ncbi:ParB/RepB/Spo0J family partition protein [Desulfofustis glycolicus]|uniref:Chromosome partitioning protein, ParB family n=1 Tax=Desulfofustis glycolicus DSM 9705 TaxID=1121409 RepID=A0A1M5WL34_9BACT|nr:ParB/RepB/Spo0J family partition protein [Desulfofustis glycolicus]MCB2217163.1 ParB/RepB/Spo0J family partition protein [Desulfobulbaceae bacterium]SHH87773.1 chromosome partitioning protein, ParB family [Desulfofustis glycolicus DSM 9705]
MAKTTGLGQGVSALFGDSPDDERFFECDIELIVPNKHQPRFVFDEAGLEELADSIIEKGIIQPLIVSKVSANRYTLIAGERRLRASKIAGLKTVPVVVQNIGDEDAFLELALIENIQRTDLNPLEEAEAYKKLIDRFGYTQEQTAQKVGKKRSTITNSLRLLLLPDYIRDDVVSGFLSEGHARSLLRIVDNPAALKEIRDQIVAKHLSVRQVESLIRKYKKPKQTENVAAQQDIVEQEISDSYCKALATQITNKLNSRVVINRNGNRGKIEIEYYSLDDLERLVSVLTSDS